MKTVSFTNYKGGCTKTTSAVGLGSALSLKGYKVLLVDMDPQSHVALHLGVNAHELPVGIEDILESRNRSIGEAIVKASQDNLYFVPSRRRLLQARATLANRAGRDALLARAARDLNGTFDFMLIDSPPDEGILSLNAMYASQYIIIPTTLEELSLGGINPVISSILDLRDAYESKHWDILGVLINRFDARSRMGNTYALNVLADAFGQNEVVFDTKIRTDEQTKRAIRHGKTIHQYKSDSKAAIDYMFLADEILDRFET